MLMPVYGEISTLIQSLLPFSPGARSPVERLLFVLSWQTCVLGRAVAPSVLGEMSIASHLQMKRVVAGLAIEGRHCRCAKVTHASLWRSIKRKGDFGIVAKKNVLYFPNKSIKLWQEAKLNCFSRRLSTDFWGSGEIIR